VFVVSFIIAYYAASQPAARYALSYDTEKQPWYSCLSATMAHMNEGHLFGNVAIGIPAGCLLEIAEGPFRLAVVMWGAATQAAAGHSLWYGRDVTLAGASGAIYGMLWNKLAILALNWSEMPLRWVRLVVAIVLLAYEIYMAQTLEGVSHACHGFGALAGITTGLCVAENLRFQRGEAALTLAGLLVYSVMGIALAASGQTAAGGLSLVIVPVRARPPA